MSKKINIKDFNSSKDEKAIRFYCYQKSYTFPLPALDADGKQIYKTDAFGNNKTALFENFSFQEIPVIDPLTKKMRPNDPRSFFEIKPNDPNAERLLEYLEKAVKDKHTKIVDEETYLKKENPEAFKIAAAKKEVEDKYTDEIADLKARLAKAESKKS